MNGFEKTQYQQAQALAQNLHHFVITLAVSLKGQLPPDEQDTLFNIFRTQMDLQMLLDEMVTVPFHTKNLSYSKE